MARRKAAPAQPVFQPRVVINPTCPLGGKFSRLLIAAQSFCGVRAVECRATMPSQLGVVDRFIPAWQLHAFRDPPEGAETSLQSALTGLKTDAVLHGASPEAVMLLGALSPFSEEELEVMADKLKTKTSAAKKPAAAAKTPAKAPAAKGKGNPEALAKAREASDGKRAAVRAMKITVLNKDHGARAGSNRATRLDIVLKAKTVEAALENGADMVDVRFAEKQGFIKLS